jgi:hypothetical protein
MWTTTMRPLSPRQAISHFKQGVLSSASPTPGGCRMVLTFGEEWSVWGDTERLAGAAASVRSEPDTR